MSVQAEPGILTIGHSNHSVSRLLELLALHGATAVADVRSQPYSRLHPDFNRETLRDALKVAGISYVYLGLELGARSKDPSCYQDGRVQYRKLAQTELFRAGIERVVQGAQTHRIALLCAEREPLGCHRAILVARELEARGAGVAHVLADGSLESHAQAVERLLALFGLQEPDMFRTRQESIEEAYARQEQRIAYVDDAVDATTEGAA